MKLETFTFLLIKVNEITKLYISLIFLANCVNTKHLNNINKKIDNHFRFSNYQQRYITLCKQENTYIPEKFYFLNYH